VKKPVFKAVYPVHGTLPLGIYAKGWSFDTELFSVTKTPLSPN
jgi:hypothetical protein